MKYLGISRDIWRYSLYNYSSRIGHMTHYTFFLMGRGQNRNQQFLGKLL